ncbi:dihydroorotase [Herbinix hemicellulosilytica]|uniref:Dihydroorotase n=1 Tax=Herbinix hemicellulosilytica TaxID=1564487 RepID=A0A0H5SFP9_HERHM|nr:dihydroorotase [Herbinix hemicellulosilytica]RBP57605.1 dihydroorotase [Herbinix hemicellulosilytica]CRZ33651.1 Dihydroorotase [Herbinix hemicellulosilytica]
MNILIKNGYVIDPKSNLEGYYDILIKDGMIWKVSKNLATENVHYITANRVIDASGKYVMPGFIDLHVHLREPGYEYKEDILSGSRAAAAGGFTTICAMPNTNPPMDCEEIIKAVIDKAKDAFVNVLPVGAITLGQEGKEISDIPALVKAGAIAISEDGKSVMNSDLYAVALKQAARLGIPVFAHCEDKALSKDGVINEGDKAKKLGLPGISNSVEDIIVARDIILAKETGAKLHLCHCSTEGSTYMLKIAKELGINVTGETCPHYFTLSDSDIPGDDSNYKMNPPLRSRKDVEAIKNALKNDILDIIATDHAPHSEEEKSRPMKNAPFGIVGLETAFSVTWTELVTTGIISCRQLVEKMSVNPAKILGIEKGCIGEGLTADVVIVDPETEYVIDKNKFLSKGKNTPFHGKKVKGRVLYTIVSGYIKYELN